MEKKEQTKGYALLVGQIFGVDNKEPRKTEYKNELNVRIKTTKEDFVFVKVGGFLSSRLSVKLKADGMEQADEVPMGEVADVVADYFKDGDSVLVRCTVDVNAYREGSINLVANGIYMCKEPLKFEDEDFRERNEVTIGMVVSGELKDDTIVGTFVNYRGEEVSKNIKVNYDPIKDYLETIKEGDLLQVILRMCSKPIYEEGEDDNGSKKTLMGRSLGRSKRKIIGNEEVIEMIDIDTERTERGKYNLDLGIATDDQDLPF